MQQLGRLFGFWLSAKSVQKILWTTISVGLGYNIYASVCVTSCLNGILVLVYWNRLFNWTVFLSQKFAFRLISRNQKPSTTRIWLFRHCYLRSSQGYYKALFYCWVAFQIVIDDPIQRNSWLPLPWNNQFFSFSLSIIVFFINATVTGLFCSLIIA